MALSPNRQRVLAQLYRKRGLSMMQIAERLDLSVSGIKYYLDKLGIKRRSISDAVTNIYRTKFKKKPFLLKRNLSQKDKELKIAGIMLYWGEGAKSGNVVKFTNSDPEMIKLFLKFMRNICGISESRLKALVHLYTDQDHDFVEKYWSSITKIPREHFYKSYIHPGKIGTYKNKSPLGTFVLNYSDKRLLRLILSWIQENYA